MRVCPLMALSGRTDGHFSMSAFRAESGHADRRVEGLLVTQCGHPVVQPTGGAAARSSPPWVTLKALTALPSDSVAQGLILK